ncbi:MAG TPA: hypothetical protein VJX47_12595, partial [Candidatus Sulfotelmatobacter sp.]|nr:hypothetical protein [Candidatus Sulfotelmatobacter sp.]
RKHLFLKSSVIGGKIACSTVARAIKSREAPDAAKLRPNLHLHRSDSSDSPANPVVIQARPARESEQD